jgi:hypothetical protein
VELRAVQKKKFKSLSSLSEYMPEIVAIEPIISVHITADKGSPSDFFFTASPEEVKDLIEALKASLEDSKAILLWSNNPQ